MTASNTQRVLLRCDESLLTAAARDEYWLFVLMVTETGQLASKPSASKCVLAQSVAEGCDGSRRAA